MKRVLTILALLTLTACDRSGAARGVQGGHDDRLYQSAMDDYRAGRIGAAIEGLQKSVRRNPLNMSARFQLACLLQDSKGDFLDAFCGYREYLLQAPDSDKAKIAQSRMEACERELARMLAEKHGLSNVAALKKERDDLEKRLQESDARLVAANKDIEELRKRSAALVAEKERLIAAVKDEGESMKSPAVDVKSLLEEPDEVDDRIKTSQDVAALRAEESDDLSTGSALLPAQTPTTETRPVGATVAEAEAPEEKGASARPSTYVVQEGDTLYRIAARFYGRIGEWKRIRDANKAQISTDGRIRAGATIVLP